MFWKGLELLKDTQISPYPWFNVVSSLEKLCQAVVTRNDQANLQPTLNKGAGCASLKNSLWLIVAIIKKELKGFFKDPKKIFCGPSWRGNYTGIFIN